MGPAMERIEMSAEHWFLFPVSVAIATVAMASGVEGATFFTPLFLVGLGLSPEIAIGTGLVTEVFGFASGVTAYIRRRLIDYRLAGMLLVAAVPLAILGTWLSGRANPDVLRVALGAMLVGVALTLFRKLPPLEIWELGADVERAHRGRNGRSCVVTSEGETICYTVCRRPEGMITAGVGAAFMGLLSTGLGELNGFFLLRRCRVPARVAVATSVLVVAITATVAATGHVARFVASGDGSLGTVLGLAAFTVPGVVIGGQIGPFVANRIPPRVLEVSLGVLFVAIGGFLILGTIGR